MALLAGQLKRVLSRTLFNPRFGFTKKASYEQDGLFVNDIDVIFRDITMDDVIDPNGIATTSIVIIQKDDLLALPEIPRKGDLIHLEDPQEVWEVVGRHKEQDDACYELYVNKDFRLVPRA